VIESLAEEASMSQLPPVTIGKLPTTIEEFVALRDAIAHEPQGGAALMVVALIVAADDEELGSSCLTVAVDRARLQESAAGYKGYSLQTADHRRIKEQLKGRAYLPRSYLKGTTPVDGYAPPPLPWTIELATNPYSGDPSSGAVKLFVASSGADSPRPIAVKRNDKGIWKASEWSSLIVGIRAPVVASDDPL
jgi:hypothetical protein